MARTESTMLALGTVAPDFTLPDVAYDRPVSRTSLLDGRPLLVMFLSRHCPYVQHVASELARIDRDYGARVSMVAISSNDTVGYPDDAPAMMMAMAREFGFRFPILNDDAQEVAKAYAAACTPDFFLFDVDGRLVYRGQLDDSRPKNARPVTGRDLRAALDAVLDGKAPPADQLPSMGCNIKWKAGNEPYYFARTR
jgi:thiol-disulfide isomerase/thioredoxin